MRHYSDFYVFYDFLHNQFKKLHIDKLLLDDDEFRSDLLLLGFGLHQRIVDHDMRLSRAMEIFEQKMSKMKSEYKDQITEI